VILLVKQPLDATRPPCRAGSALRGRTPGACAVGAAPRSGAACSSMGRFGNKDEIDEVG